MSGLEQTRVAAAGSFTAIWKNGPSGFRSSSSSTSPSALALTAVLPSRFYLAGNCQFRADQIWRELQG